MNFNKGVLIKVDRPSSKENDLRTLTIPLLNIKVDISLAGRFGWVRDFKRWIAGLCLGYCKGLFTILAPSFFKGLVGISEQSKLSAQIEAVKTMKDTISVFNGALTQMQFPSFWKLPRFVRSVVIAYWMVLRQLGRDSINFFFNSFKTTKKINQIPNAFEEAFYIIPAWHGKSI
jgi:hypothetical protein